MTGFTRRLLAWYDRHGRHDLPWQHPRTPYRVWISEVMLQQTRVTTVIAYFERFVAALPDVAALAAADEDRVLALWAGLGYYRRARYLHAAAEECVVRHRGRLPDDFHALAALPGIGRSTAGAILALAHGQRHAILDGNVKRVLARFHGVRGWPGERAIADALWTHAESHTPHARVADFTQAIMDLGATVCTRANPRCNECPLAPDCVAHREGVTADLPTRRPARALPERQTLFVVLRDSHGRVLLQRRPATGVWPRLWSLPEAADERAARTVAARFAMPGDIHPEKLPEIRHTFTHFRLHAIPVEWRKVRPRADVADDPDIRWCDRRQVASMGIPAPVARFLRGSFDGSERHGHARTGSGEPGSVDGTQRNTGAVRG